MRLRDFRNAAGDWVRASYMAWIAGAYAWWAPWWLRLVFVFIVTTMIWLATWNYR